MALWQLDLGLNPTKKMCFVSDASKLPIDECVLLQDYKYLSGMIS